MKFFLNDELIVTDKHPGTTLLDFIRNEKCLKGTNEACREGECGACTVLISEINSEILSYKAVASCLLPLGAIQNMHVVTIEGLNVDSGLNLIQQAIVEYGATQCGFCTPGFVLSLTGFFINSENLSYSDAIDAMDGNICRCTGYVSIQKAAKFLSEKYSKKFEKKNNRLKQLVDWAVLPGYFNKIEEKLQNLDKNNPVGISGEYELIVAGGTDLYVQKGEELEEKKLEFLSHRKDLFEIKMDKEFLYIGGAVTVEQLKKSQLCRGIFPNLDNYMNLVSSTILRNSATIAGNIVNASPIGDMTIMFLPVNCILQLNNGKKRREVLLHKFYKGYRDVDLKKNEIIEWIKMPILSKESFYNFEKVSKRKHLDIASVNSAVYGKVKDDIISEIKISAGGVGPFPLLLNETSKFLKDKKVKSDIVVEAAQVAIKEVVPISDIRGSEDYKRLLLRQIIYGHFIKLFPDKIKFEELM